MGELGNLAWIIWPELLLAVVACLLFLMGVRNCAHARRACAVLAIAALAAIFVGLTFQGAPDGVQTDAWRTVRLYEFGYYVKLLSAGVGVILLLLAWPSNKDASGNSALNFSKDAGEFFGLMLLSICGIMLTVSSNDVMLLFLAIELASIPTYIIVAISRPISVAQEAGVKYFFLGAMAAAIMLFGFSYLYGTTGLTNLQDITQSIYHTMQASAGANGELSAPVLSPWQLIAAMTIILGLAFKMAVVPLHFYVADVYQGAATPVTAFLSFVPKITGFVALIKMLYVFSGGTWHLPGLIAALLWTLAILTMCVGNALGLLQFNVKRVLGYSSIAHSGYMLVGLAALAYAPDPNSVRIALGGVMFYLAAYGIANSAAFGVLMMLPAKPPAFGPSDGKILPATSAETFDDIAGQGRHHVALGLAMAVTCLSLTGIPLTVGFFAKFLVVKPAFLSGLYGLAVLTMINAAVSAVYYLRIIASMFLRPESETTSTIPSEQEPEPASAAGLFSLPIAVSIALSVGGTLLFGAIYPATDWLANSATDMATNMDVRGAAMPIVVQNVEPIAQPVAR